MISSVGEDIEQRDHYSNGDGRETFQRGGKPSLPSKIDHAQYSLPSTSVPRYIL